MASSGTYSFSMTRDDVIGAALRTLGAFGSQDTIPAADITNCAQALNILVKSWPLKGLPLWCVLEVTVPCVVGQGTYTLGPANPSSPLRPLRILDAFLRNTNNGNTDVILQVESRYDFDMLGFKASPGIPNQLFYDPQATNGLVTLYNVPNLTGYELHVVIQRQIQDFNLAADNPDMPAEAFQALKWGLANELVLEYGNPQLNLAKIEKNATMYLNDLMAFEQEFASVYFTPATRSM